MRTGRCNLTVENCYHGVIGMREIIIYLIGFVFFLLLVGNSLAVWCYQETANVSTSCGGLNWTNVIILNGKLISGSITYNEDGQVQFDT